MFSIISVRVKEFLNLLSRRIRTEASNSDLILFTLTLPSCLCRKREERKEAVSQVSGRSRDSSTSKCRVRTCSGEIPGMYFLRVDSSSWPDPMFPWQVNK